jgi:predicted MFS family arabinose efflux permease
MASFTSMAAMRACDALLPRLAETFDVTTGVAAQTIAAFAIAYGALQLFYGPAGDRFGKLRVMSWAAAFCAIANLGFATADSLGTGVVWRVLAGAASGGIVPLSLAAIGDGVGYERRQLVLSRLMLATILGMISGQWLGGLLGDQFGWRTVFVLLGVIFGLASWRLFVAAGRERERRAVSPAAPPGRFFASLGQILVVPWARRVLLAVGIEGLFFYAAIVFVPSYLHHEFDLTLGQAGAVMALYGAGGLVFVALAKRLIPRIGERGTVQVGGVILGLGLLVLAIGPAWWWALPACFLAGLGLYMLHSALQAHATQMVPAVRATAVSFFVVCLFSGQSIGVAIAAWVVDTQSARWVFATAGLALPLMGWWFARALAARARSES